MQNQTTISLQQQLQHAKSQAGNFKMKFADSAAANIDLTEQIRTLNVERMAISQLLTQARTELKDQVPTPALQELFAMLPPEQTNISVTEEENVKEQPLPDAEPSRK